MVEFLVANGADVMHRDKERDAPINRAVIRGHAAIVELLLDAGADIEASGTLGYTPLELARSYDRTKVIELLMQRRAVH